MPGRIHEVVHGFEDAAGELEGLEGLKGGYLLVDDQEGLALTLTLWDTRAALLWSLLVSLAACNSRPSTVKALSTTAPDAAPITTAHAPATAPTTQPVGDVAIEKDVKSALADISAADPDS